MSFDFSDGGVMGKAPAFQFYASDFLTGTSEMTSMEIGVYIRLLAFSWDKGPLPLEHWRLARMVGESVEAFEAVWTTVGQKWVRTDDGYVNERLEEQRKEREEFAARQSERGKRSAEKRTGAQRPRSIPVEPEGQPKVNQGPLNSSVFDLQSSTRESKDHSLSTRARVNPHAKPTNLINGPDMRKHGEHAVCFVAEHPSLCVSVRMLDILADMVGGDRDEAKRWLKTDVMPAAIHALGDAPAPDALMFWKAAVKTALERRQGHRKGSGVPGVPDVDETMAMLERYRRPADPEAQAS